MNHKLQSFLEQALIGCLVMILLIGLFAVLPTVNEVSHTVGNRELPVYCVDTSKPQISLTFDAAWGNEDLDAILAILSKHQVSACFFITGEFLDQYPEEVQKILDQGHELGNHGNKHKDMTTLSVEEQLEELNTLHQKVKEKFQVEMKFFRPPYGAYNNAVILTAQSAGYISVQWSVDSLDWKNYGVESIIDTVINHKELENGAIILMHNGTKYTAQALERMLIQLKQKGYTFVPLSQLVLTENYYLDHTGKQFSK
ncbi:MAG: polysaccharide deacetylase family protein [Lachnospiraceae bacterium]